MANVSSSNGLEKRPTLSFRDANGAEFPNWQRISLGTIIEPYSEKVHGNHDYEVLTSSREGLQRQTEHFGSKQRHDTDGYNIVPLGFCTYRNRSDDGRFAFNINKISDKAIVSKFYPVFRFVNANSTFMTEYLNSSARARKKLSVLAVGTSQVVLSFEALKSAKFDLPCKEEQDKIAALLECINTRIAQQHAYVNALKKYKRGFISEVLKQKLILSREGEKWEEVSLSDVADGFEYGMNAAATSFDGEHKYIRITDIDDDAHTYIASAPVSPSGDLEEKYRVRENDILFARTGASVGKSYLYRKTDGDLFFAGFLIRIHVKEGVDSGYVFLNTLTEDYDKWVLLESARSGQPGINAEQYKRYSFKLPPLKIQKQISGIVQKMDEQIKREYLCLRLLQKQRDGMLQQLFI